MKIHLDFDETLTHSMYARDKGHAEELEELFYGFENVSYELDDGWYVTFLRSFARDLIKFCQDLVGEENVFICSIGTRDYVTTACRRFDLNIPENRINAREDLDGIEHSDYDKNILIDNYGYFYHATHGPNKVKFLNLKMENLIQVTHFFADYDQRNEDEEFEKIKEKLTRRVEILKTRIQ